MALSIQVEEGRSFTKTLRLAGRLDNETAADLDRELDPAQAGPVRLADLAKGDRTLRIAPASTPLPADTLVPGTVLTISQNGPTDTQVVQSAGGVLPDRPGDDQYHLPGHPAPGPGISLVANNPAAVESQRTQQ
jgi:hypothetical protein